MKTIKDKRNTRLLRGLLIIAANIFPFFAMAQDPGPCPDCPIDNGIWLLLAAGVGFGVKKYRDAKKLV